MKGVVTIVELALVILVLIGTFTVFFPRFVFESRWEDALLLLKGRDALLTMDRVGELYEHSFNSSSLSNFLGRIFPGEPLIFLPVVEGTIKSRIHVACNCTDEEKKMISDWLNGPKGKAILRINERDIDFYVCTTHLEELNPCLSEYADVLIIWGRKSLTLPKYVSLLRGHLERGNGIIQVRDFLAGDIDAVQSQIFGLSWAGVAPLPSFDEFARKPTNASDIVYGPWKYFYHIPINLEYITSEPISGCAYQPSAKGNFTFNQTSYTFWICDANSIWLDVNRNGLRELNERINVGSNFQIAGYSFYLSYVRDNISIGISFKPLYNFTDFLRVDGSAYNIQPGDANLNRVVLVARPQNLPVVILIVTPISKVAWVASFTEGGVGDDERLLFISLLLWVSNKREFLIEKIVGLEEFFKTAYSISYINAINRDMFEVYGFKLIMGYPY